MQPGVSRKTPIPSPSPAASHSRAWDLAAPVEYPVGGPSHFLHRNAEVDTGLMVSAEGGGAHFSTINPCHLKGTPCCPPFHTLALLQLLLQLLLLLLLLQLSPPPPPPLLLQPPLLLLLRLTSATATHGSQGAEDSQFQHSTSRSRSSSGSGGSRRRPGAKGLQDAGQRHAGRFCSRRQLLDWLESPFAARNTNLAFATAHAFLQQQQQQQQEQQKQLLQPQQLLHGVGDMPAQPARALNHRRSSDSGSDSNGAQQQRASAEGEHPGLLVDVLNAVAKLAQASHSAGSVHATWQPLMVSAGRTITGAM